MREDAARYGLRKQDGLSNALPLIRLVFQTGISVKHVWFIGGYCKTSSFLPFGQYSINQLSHSLHQGCYIFCLGSINFVEKQYYVNAGLEGDDKEAFMNTHAIEATNHH